MVVAIGHKAKAQGFGSVSVGVNAFACGDPAANQVVIGNAACSFSNGGIAIGKNAKVASAADNSIAIGISSCAAAADSVVVGSNTISGGTGSIGIGTCVLPATNSIVIGNSSCSFGNNQVILGNSLTPLNCASGAIPGSIVIGSCLSVEQNTAWNNTNIGSINIGYTNLHNCASAGIVIGTFNCQINSLNNNSPFNHSILIGYENDGFSNYGNIVGDASINCGVGSQLFGSQNTSVGPNSFLFGLLNQTQSGADTNISLGSRNTVFANVCCGSILGHCNSVCHNNSVAIGFCLTTEKTNTTHVDNIIAFGQGASKYHTVGDITGNITLDWNNGNNQSTTLTGAVNLGFSNPIAGGNYGIAITQGGTGGYGITWAGVLWANATPPTLSASVGAVDFVNLVYNGTNYYGSYGNNFA